MKRTIAAFAMLLAASSFAVAQETLVEVADDVQVAPLGANADTVDDWDVHSADGLEIGEVDEVLGSDARTATALAVDFEGNGGYADRDVVVPLGQFTLMDGRLVLNADPAAIDALPTWDD